MSDSKHFQFKRRQGEIWWLSAESGPSQTGYNILDIEQLIKKLLNQREVDYYSHNLYYYTIILLL